jgi:NAD(P)-dependent dehydrogenase (short-subunit alcohol dehydrogenase family)/catechol 2,3-dioxygenase-like lactoylglutathione lyase family enzyme
MSELSKAFASGQVAVVTGAASGIGLAAARRLAAMGLKVVLADLPGEALERAALEVIAAAAGGATDVVAVPADVARPADLAALRERVSERFGAVSVLMNNAGKGDNPGLPWENSAGWKSLLDVNLWGVVHGVEAFLPSMLASNAPGVIINTGSKQGITSPPGNAAYNLSKAGVKSYTESLSHELVKACSGRITAHLLIPGFTFTGMTGAASKPAAAWTPDQVIDFMLASLARGDFYILCPDNAVDRAMDEKRIRWAADDLILNRPALSRWHPQYEAAFAQYMERPLKLAAGQPGIRDIVPILFVRDVTASAAFFRDKLGFEIDFLWPAQPTPFYGAVSRGEARLLLRFVHRTSFFPQLAAQEESLILASVQVADAQGLLQLFEEFKGKGVDIPQTPTQHPWGGTDFHVRDPDGNVISFLTFG